MSVPTLSPSSKLYFGTEAGGSALLLAATVLALAWANSPWADSYASFWSTEATIGVGDLQLTLDLRHWVNDAAMALFFLVVGLEITREVSVGELRDRRNVAAPALGALGGLHHMAISVEPEHWAAAIERLDAAGVAHEVHSEVSVYFQDPDGARIELIADPLGEMYGDQVL